MKQQKTKDEIKKKLIQKYGLSSFTATWDELAELCETSIPNVRYHILRLVEENFLEQIKGAERVDGKWSSGEYKIVEEQAINTSISLDKDYNQMFVQMQESLNGLVFFAKKLEQYEAEREELKKKSEQLEEQNKQLRYNALMLSTKINEITNLGLAK